MKGSVFLPGEYGWTPQMKLSQLIRLAGGFRPVAGRAHIERLNPESATRYLVTVQLPEDSVSAFPDDIALREYDVVTIYNRDNF